MNPSTALAHPNIVFIKYWGNCDPHTRIPANGSISMNLDGLYSRRRMIFDSDLASDVLVLNDQLETGSVDHRVSEYLDWL